MNKKEFNYLVYYKRFKRIDFVAFALTVRRMVSASFLNRIE